MKTPKINIAIADDHLLVREGMAKIISSLGNYEIDIQVGDGEELIRSLSCASVLPDICIIDLGMPNMGGWETLAEIKRRWNTIRTLVMTILDGDDIVQNVINNHGDGYLCKNCRADEIRCALEKLCDGDYYFPHAYSKLVFKSIVNNERPVITKKELQFLSHCCDDSSYKEIAVQMNVSTRTVEGYRDSLFEKLNIRTRVGLAMYALKNGIVTFFEKKRISV